MRGKFSALTTGKAWSAQDARSIVIVAALPVISTAVVVEESMVVAVQAWRACVRCS